VSVNIYIERAKMQEDQTNVDDYSSENEGYIDSNSLGEPGSEHEMHQLNSVFREGLPSGFVDISLSDDVTDVTLDEVVDNTVVPQGRVGVMDAFGALAIGNACEIF
jgi:hypothetical protein